MSELNFEEQRRAANANIREMKVVTPFIFPEWQRIQYAVDRVRAANLELEHAQAAWDKLGQDDVGS